MPGFIPDASVTLPWRFEDEATPWTEALLERIRQGEEALVPAHWPLEVLNTLVMAKRRGRLSTEQVIEFITDLRTLPIRVEAAASPVAWQSLLMLAEQYRLTVYDAAYLELALRTRHPLATMDRELFQAAQTAGAHLVERP